MMIHSSASTRFILKVEIDALDDAPLGETHSGSPHAMERRTKILQADNTLRVIAPYWEAPSQRAVERRIEIPELEFQT